ncbi:hypothetical protein F2Q69_00016033 [Brassica cretica]|uniref:Uncharacterized protein n=1 Tax=Brassica cretica TaxID=69181 RepID=A0A8S9QUV6_BRACR|nr:hypothetical protein F2Q69_00016033 [Brassica cretica]
MRNTFIKGRNRESKIEKESQLENIGTLIERNRENPGGELAKTVKRFTTSRRQKPAKTVLRKPPLPRGKHLIY